MREELSCRAGAALELARTMIWKAAWALDHPAAVADRSVADLPLHVIARVYTAEAVNDVALLAALLAADPARVRGRRIVLVGRKVHSATRALLGDIGVEIVEW